MNLVSETGRFIRWTLGVTRRFLRVRPWSTCGVILISAVDGVLQLLAFLVPLKIILLAASPGIPRYFPFIDPADKPAWIIALSVAAVSAYLTSLLLNALSDRWSRSAGQDVLRVANDLSVHAKEEDQIQRAFSGFTGVVGSLIFLSVASAALLWANPSLAVFLGVMLAALFLVSFLTLAGDEEPAPAFKAWMLDKSKQYLGFWHVLTFFGAFAVIIYPFLSGHGGNIFLAIIGFILVRRMLGNITGLVSTAVGLVRKRSAIDALIYRSRQVADSSKEKRFRSLRVVLSRERREPAFVDALKAVLGEGVDVQTTYVDPEPAPIKRFDVELFDRARHPIHLEARAFPENCQDQVANAAFLFRHLPREALGAPPIRATFDYEDYTVVVQDAGSGKRCQPGRAWLSLQKALIGQMLAVVPPKRLVKSYRDTHLLLPERLTSVFCERLWIGVDDRAEAELLKAWLAHLPGVTQALRAQPVALYNPEINPANVINERDQPLVLAWGKWGLEPLGAAMARHDWAKKGEEHLEALKASRADLTGRHWSGDLALGAECHALEKAIAKEQYKAGLAKVGDILERVQSRASELPSASTI